MIWNWDLRTRQVLCNAALVSTLGEFPSDTKNALEWWRERLHPDDAGGPAARALAQQALLDQDDPRQPGPAQEVSAPRAYRPAAHHHGIRCITHWHAIDAGID